MAQELTELEPGNTTYRRDLSTSFERLAMIAAEQEQPQLAMDQLAGALHARWGLYRQEPFRVDLAEELAVTLALAASVTTDPADGELKSQQISDLLSPFE